jgi:hypothetical protein
VPLPPEPEPPEPLLLPPLPVLPPEPVVAGGLDDDPQAPRARVTQAKTLFRTGRVIKRVIGVLRESKVASRPIQARFSRHVNGALSHIWMPQF